MTKERRLGVKNGFSLPIKWITEEWRTYTLTRVEADREELERLLEARLFRQLSAALEGRGEATRTHMTSAAAGDLLTLTLRAECLERIDLDDPGED